MTNDFQERDPDQVRRELRWRRAAATALFHRLNGNNRDGIGVGVELALRECHAYADEHLTPAAVLFWTTLDILDSYLDALLGTEGRERLLEALQGEMQRYAGIPGPPEPAPGGDADGN